MNQRGSALVLAIFGVFIAAGLGAGVYYFLSLNKTVSNQTETPVLYSPTPVPTQVPVKTTQSQDWQLYSNFDLPITFSYPSSLNLNEELRPIASKGVTGNILIQNWDSNSPHPNTQADFQILIEVSKNVANGKIQSLNEFIENEPGSDVNLQKLTSIQVGNKQGLRGEILLNNQTVPVVWINYEDYVFKMILATPASANASWFEEVLKTFKQKEVSPLPEERIFESYSPDHSYKVTYSMSGDAQKLAIKDRNYKNITENALALNGEAIKTNMTRLGLVGGGQSAYQFKDWISNSVFILQILPANGMEFEVEIDAATGKTNEASFKKIK